MTLSSAEPMPIARAVDINGRLTEAYLVRAAIRSGPVPSLQGIRLSEALCAVSLLRGQPLEQREDGWQSFNVIVVDAEIARLFAWAVVRSQMT